MGRPIFLQDLRARVRFQSDTQGATSRHTDADLNTEINESWQALRELVSDNGHKLYLKEATGNLTIGPLAGASFGTLTLPPDCIKIYGLDVLYNGIRRPVLPAEFQQRNEFYDAFGQSLGVPIAFHLYNIGTEVFDGVTAGSIALYPAPDQAYAYSLWYLPNWTPVTDAGVPFDGVAGWDQWVVWDVCAKLALRDADMLGTYQALMAERQKAEERILKSANHMQRVGPSRRVDVAAIKRRNVRNSYLRRPL